MQEIFQAIKRSAAKIAEAIHQEERGYSHKKNSSGEQQLKLDILSDEIIENELGAVSSVKVLASEEKSEPMLINGGGRYLIGYDPLDGSSLVDVNLSVGSIFGIYEESFDAPNLIAAAYVVYGPRVEMVISTVKAERFLLSDGEFSFVEELSLGEKGKINAPGGTQKEWFAHHKELIDSLFKEGYRLRYSGGMVPDLHQILVKKGGLFSYPGTQDRPKGKLRKVFEVFPFAHVFEKAGGYAIDDRGERILSQRVNNVHETTPCFFGSKYEIETVKRFYERTK